MKLMVCPECSDVVSLRSELRSCFCGKSAGQYVDKLNAVLHGAAIPLGFLNHEFVEALRKQPQVGDGKTFTAFVIPQRCPTVSYQLAKLQRSVSKNP